MLSIYNKIKHFWFDPSTFKYKLVLFTTFQATMSLGYYIRSIAGLDTNYGAIFLSYGILNTGLLLTILNHEETKPIDAVRIFMRVDDIPN